MAGKALQTSVLRRLDRDRFLQLRQSYIELCGGDHCAAALLAFFEYQANLPGGPDCLEVLSRYIKNQPAVRNVPRRFEMIPQPSELVFRMVGKDSNQMVGAYHDPPVHRKARIHFCSFTKLYTVFDIFGNETEAVLSFSG